MILAVPKDVRQDLAVVRHVIASVSGGRVQRLTYVSLIGDCQGDVVIPVAKSPGPVTQVLKTGFRKRMASLGLYAGVEYRVVGIVLRRDATGQSKITVQSIKGLRQEDW